MYKATYWIVWFMTLLAVNLAAIPIAIYSLFAIGKGTSITIGDYILGIAVLLLSNIITIQLFITTRKQLQKYFLIGFIVSVVQLTSFTLFMNMYVTPAIVLFTASVLAAVILLIKTVKATH